MSWLSVLVALALGVAIPSPAGEKGAVYGRGPLVIVHHHVKPHHKKKKAKPKAKPKATPTPVAAPTPGPSGSTGITVTPGATATPTATPRPTATPTPRATTTATPVPTPTATSAPLPTRTGVDLNDRDETGYTLVASHATLGHGSIEFVGNNKGMDDHNLTVKQGGHDFGSVFLPAGESDSLVLTLPAGTYTLYCSLSNHEQLGMHEDITVK